MNCIRSVFDRPATDNISISLGNMVISGVKNIGRNKAMHDLLEIHLTANRTMVILQDMVTKDEYTSLIAETSSYMFGKKTYSISLNSEKDTSIDILSVFSDASKKAEFVLSLFSMIADVPEMLKNKIHRFFFYAMDTFDNISRFYKLEDLMHIDIDEVVAAVESSGFDELEKKRRIRFLSDASTFSSFMDIESYMMQIESSGIAKTYSGNNSFFDAVNNGNLVIVSGFVGEDKKKREVLINSFLTTLSEYIDVATTTNPCAVVLKNIDYVKEDAVNALMEYDTASKCVTYTLIEDVSKYIEKNGNELLDRTKSFLVFTQGSDANASFWSAFFGSRDVQEPSFSYTKKKSWNPFSTMMDSGGVIASPKKYNSTTTNIQKVNKPIYRVEVFRELHSNEVMCYLREPLMRRKSRIE